MTGFRDIAVHDYARIEMGRVWRIVQDDLPELIRLTEPLLPAADE